MIHEHKNIPAVQKNVPLFEQEIEKTQKRGNGNTEETEVANFVEFIMKFVRQLEKSKTLTIFCSNN